MNKMEYLNIKELEKLESEVHESQEAAKELQSQKVSRIMGCYIAENPSEDNVILLALKFDKVKENVRDNVYHLIEEVASNPTLKSFQSKTMEKYLRQILEENPFIQLIAVTDKNGTRVTNNIVNIVDKHKYEHFTKGDFSDSEWFLNPMKTGKIYVTDF